MIVNRRHMGEIASADGDTPSIPIEEPSVVPVVTRQEFHTCTSPKMIVRLRWFRSGQEDGVQRQKMPYDQVTEDRQDGLSPRRGG